jgi:ABC-type lipoprotein export system ATPase subunit
VIEPLSRRASGGFGDEPTGNPDSASAASMMALFDTRVADHRTIASLKPRRR